jgi:hypothetical protein
MGSIRDVPAFWGLKPGMGWVETFDHLATYLTTQGCFLQARLERTDSRTERVE